MSQNISELAKALRDAADAIEKAPPFTFNEDIDIATAVKFIQAHMPKNDNVYLRLEIKIDGYANKEVSVQWSVDESYTTVAKAADFQGCMGAYAKTKEDPDSLASVARLVKTACKIEGEPAPSLDTPEVSA